MIPTARRLIIDIVRRFRRPASGPTEYYQEFLNFNMAAGVNLLPLRAQRTPATMAFIQNDADNLGYLSVGGQNVNLLNGARLDPGQALVITAEAQDMGALGTRMAAGSLGAGVMGNIEALTAAGMHPEEVNGFMNSIFDPNLPRVVFLLNQIFVISDLAAQNVRILYTQHQRIPGR